MEQVDKAGRQLIKCALRMVHKPSNSAQNPAIVDPAWACPEKLSDHHKLESIGLSNLLKLVFHLRFLQANLKLIKS